MLVDVSDPAYCEGIDSCGLAMACRDNGCGPCGADTDCAAGEACVLDHCIRQEHVACRSVHDCAAETTCVLSGYTAGRRGNEDMRAFCQPTSGEGAPEPAPNAAREIADEVPTPDARPVSITRLREALVLPGDSSDVE